MDSMAPLKYDYLVLALGAVVNFFQTPGADQYAFPLYTMDDAIRLKEHVLKTLEAVDKNPSLIDDVALNFCVVGGGATGVEVSGAAADLLHSELKQDYPNLPVDRGRSSCTSTRRICSGRSSPSSKTTRARRSKNAASRCTLAPVCERLGRRALSSRTGRR
jgi:hypothetical protein